jgi:UDP-glucose 4-epimerase
MSERALVTGGAGFIGSHIVDALLDAGYAVAVVDNLRSGRRENVNPRARLYEVDIRDASALADVFARERPTLVSHQAALADVRESLGHPDEYASVNVVGTIQVLEAARRNGATKIMFASTGGAIYGERPEMPTPETVDAHPLDFYGVSKLAGEHYLYGYRHNYGLDYCALRYGNVFGPRQNAAGEAGVIAIFASRMLKAQPVEIYGDGLQQRDFVYVGDVARANVLAAQQGSGIYNIGTGVATNINDIFHELARLTRYPLSIAHAPAKPGEVRRSCIDPGKAKRELGWQPAVALTEGLARTVAFFTSWAESQPRVKAP